MRVAAVSARIYNWSCGYFGSWSCFDLFLIYFYYFQTFYRLDFIDSFFFAGDLPPDIWAEQGDGEPDAPQQHRWSWGHVHTGRAAWSCHHAQPLPALPERQHLRKAPPCLCTTMMYLEAVGLLSWSGVYSSCFWELLMFSAARQRLQSVTNIKNINRQIQFLVESFFCKVTSLHADLRSFSEKHGCK